MKPEQAKAIREAIGNYEGTRENGAYVTTWEHIEAFDALLAEHATMKDELRWRVYPDSEPDENATVFFRRAAEETGDEVGSCFGCELRDGDEWLPVPP